MLIRGGRVIKNAPTALKLLEDNDIPFIILTNSGGLPEEVRAESLSKRLGVKISTEQFVQSHTPLQLLTSEYPNVLVFGGNKDNCRKIALK